MRYARLGLLLTGILVAGGGLGQAVPGGPAYVPGVTQLIAGTGVSLSPSGGTGAVTVTATGAAGTVTTSGTPTSGQFAEFTAASVIQGLTLGGDCTLSTATITCTQTSGTPFGTFATQNYATPPAIGGTTPAAGKFTTLTSTDTTNGAKLAGVTNASGPGPGNIGEQPQAWCIVSGTNYQVTLTTVTGYATWPSGIPFGGSSAYPWTCGFYVNTGAGGISTSTQYWITEGSVGVNGANTFTVSSTVANALAGTADVTLSSGSPTVTAGVLEGSTGAIENAAVLNVPAGDFQCYGAVQLGALAAAGTTTTKMEGGFATSASGTRPTTGIAALSWSDVSIPSGSVGSSQVEQFAITPYTFNNSGATTLYLNADVATGTPNNYYLGGGINCMRFH